MRITRFIVGLLIAGSVVVFTILTNSERPNSAKLDSASNYLPINNIPITGYSRAMGLYEWEFPRDHGPHPDYQTEWWYYTGNLSDETGRRFGFQFTVFRRAFVPVEPDSESEWRTNQIYMAHFTITDVAANKFYQHQRFSRGAAGVSGATTEPRYRVWLDDWEIIALNNDATKVQIAAVTEDASLDLLLNQVKPPALQGDNGLSAKNSAPGNASYYYSLSRLETSGTITLEDVTYTVLGSTWMDHEFGTSSLGPDAQGWDWFGLQLDNEHELMVGQIRLIGGGREPAFGGLLILPDGTTQYLDSKAFSIKSTRTWTSPHTGTTYPSSWDISVQVSESRTWELILMPLIANQELNEGEIIYWEGAVAVSGDVTGYGYAELTGYQEEMQGRF